MNPNICWLCKLFREDENRITSNWPGSQPLYVSLDARDSYVQFNCSAREEIAVLCLGQEAQYRQENGGIQRPNYRVSLEEVLQWSQSFEKLMATKYGPIIYKIYLKTEYSDENIEFWTACETYKKIASQRKRNSLARKIFKNYIGPHAPKEINIDSPAREAIIRNIQEPTQSCFDEAQRIVYMHMERDSYPRFLGSEIYQKLKHSLQTDSNDSIR